MSLWGGTKRRADGMIGYVILSGICLILIGIRPSVVLATIGLFGFGLSIAFIDTHWQILIQSKVGLELQARVFSINEMLAFIMRPLAFFLAGLCQIKYLNVHGWRRESCNENQHDNRKR